MLRQMQSLFLIGLLLITTGCGSPSPVKVSGSTGTEPVEILRQHMGNDEAFAKIGGMLLNSASDTTANLGTLAPDFNTESVIVVALGEVPTAGFGITITGVQKQGDKVFVQFKTSQPGDVAAQVISYPFAAVAVPKLTGTLFLEESN